MSVALLLLTTLVLIYLHVSRLYATGWLALAAVAGMWLGGWHWAGILFGTLTLLLILLVMWPSPLRRSLLSAGLLAFVRGMLPALSTTEQQALEAGTVDWDGELFSGKPDWQRLLATEHPRLTEREQAFLDGPVTTLCTMLDDWSVTNEGYDLPAEAWDYMREQGFFGLVIEQEYGGLGFSHLAHSEIVMKCASRGVSLAVTVMVPNSLGPGELLAAYGTEAQKAHYLPRLARGEEIPCFALTSPVAGSDAGAIPDSGVVCRGHWNGEEVLGLKVTWNKRYITLAPVATLIGLAIKVFDPDDLLGRGRELGVTAVMVPSDTPGVNHGPRHMPMNTVFMNGPTWGEDVFIPMEQVIGGEAMIGEGWKMLLERLSIGRSISLPALGVAGAKMACLTTGAYAEVREQFGRSISNFEGVQEALEPMAGYTWMMDAARIFTAGMVDRGGKPSVPSALLKYRNTDLMRDVVTHAMDVVAGRAVIRGPRNFLARVYQAIPIAITVEGANILTRSLMVFGQGAIRCHPYIVEEIEAAGMLDEAQAVKRFDAVFFPHLAHSSRNLLRSLLLGVSGGRLERVPAQGGISRYYRQLSRFSATFALMTDVSLITLGGSLKARQRFSGRMADALVALYYASASIRQWHEEGYPEELREVVQWSLEQSLYDLQKALYDAIIGYPVRGLRWPLLLIAFPLGRRLKKPDDERGRRVALSIVAPGPARDRLVRGVYIADDPKDAVGRVMNALKLSRETADARKRINEALREAEAEDRQEIELLLGHQRDELLDWAIKRNVISENERAAVAEALAALYDVIRVDAFSKESIEALAAASKGTLELVTRPATADEA
ncbi:MAG: acyl-CoA dehydrogenase [Gammaproteobacteria bacterium]|nr:acyl-CoA dehydrogenase [Gammaproteobacteria bacterium]